MGLQITGRRHADDVVLRLARLFELAQPWPRHAPAPGLTGGSVALVAQEALDLVDQALLVVGEGVVLVVVEPVLEVLDVLDGLGVVGRPAR